jgi:hypothetical protein
MVNGYIYGVKINNLIFKIGKSGNILKRLKDYEREYGSDNIDIKYIYKFKFFDYNILENNIITIFKNKFKIYKGREYFKGNIIEMEHTFLNFITNIKIKEDLKENEYNENKYMMLEDQNINIISKKK